jgi:hypothetical protein
MGITRWFAIIVKVLGGQDVRHTLEALDCHVGAKLKLTKTADRGAARARFFALAPHGDLTNGWTQLESSDLPCVGEIYETPLRAQSRTAAQWKFARCLSIAWVKDATI